MKRIILSFFSLSLIGSALTSQNAYEIKVSIKNCTDEVCFLTKYTWQSPYKVDSAKVDKSGNMVFKGAKALEKGIYSIYSPKRSALYFDFLVDCATTICLELSKSQLLHLK